MSHFSELKSVGLPHMISGGIFDYKEDKMRFLVMPKYAGSLEAVRLVYLSLNIIISFFFVISLRTVYLLFNVFNGLPCN